MIISDWIEFQWHDMTQYVRLSGDNVYDVRDMFGDHECTFKVSVEAGERQFYVSRAASPNFSSPNSKDVDMWTELCTLALEAFVAHEILASSPKGGYSYTSETTVTHVVVLDWAD